MSTRLQNFDELTESIGTPAVDREAGVIRNVKILGAVSKNGREYSDRALQEAAAIYNRKDVNTNHPSRQTPNASRSIEEGIGWLENIKVKPGDGVYGDLAVIKSHPMADSLFEVAERNPARFGLSHNASGDVVERGGKRIVESIKGVRSVDLVQNPATVNGLFESEEPVSTKTTTVKQIFEATVDAVLKTKRLKLLEMDGMADMGALPVDVPAEGAESALSSDAAAKAAFKEAIAAIIDDDALSWEDTKARVAQLLDTMATMSGGDTPATEEDAVSESRKETEDQKRIRLLEERNADLEATSAARNLLESSKVKSTPTRINTIKRTADKTERKELIEGWLKEDSPNKSTTPQKPQRSAPLFEDTQGGGYKPANNAKELAARLR